MPPFFSFFFPLYLAFLLFFSPTFLRVLQKNVGRIDLYLLLSVDIFLGTLNKYFLNCYSQNNQRVIFSCVLIVQTRIIRWLNVFYFQHILLSVITRIYNLRSSLLQCSPVSNNFVLYEKKRNKILTTSCSYFFDRLNVSLEYEVKM